MPGFFDMHFHWVQDDVRTQPKDSLLEWLEKYTFPAEMKFADPKYAASEAKIFFKRLSRVGTLGGACYSSIHGPALECAMSEVKGDFVIGNVLMDQFSPPELTQTEAEAIALTKKMIRKFGRRFAFTPRFAISTSPALMKKGSKLADQAHCFKQSHLSENPAEIEFVLKLYKKLPGYKKCSSYTDIYKKTGMLGKRSLMGHGIHLSSAELKMLHETKTTLIHCPTSNAPIREKGLGSGLFDFKRVERAKVRWALGSDIGGGPFLSMFDVMRSFVIQNKRAKVKGATFVKALYRSTLSGAEVFGIAAKTGNLNRKKEVNFIVVPLNASKPPHSAEDALKRIINAPKAKRELFDQLPSVVYYRGKPIVNQA